MKLLNIKFVSSVGFVCCVIGWLGLFYVAPLTIFCGIFLIKNKHLKSGITCMFLGLIQLYLIIRPPVSW